MAEAKQRDQWQHTAQQLAMTANCNRDAKKQPEAFTADDFNPLADAKHKPTAKEQADQSLLDKYVS